MPSTNRIANPTAALAQAIKQQVLDKLEQTLEIEIPRALRAELLKGQSRATGTHLVPAEPAGTHPIMPQGEKCAAIWTELDRMVAKGKEPTLEMIRAVGERKGWNEHTTRIQFYRWRHSKD
jgi:hypothetical protein